MSSATLANWLAFHGDIDKRRPRNRFGFFFYKICQKKSFQFEDNLFVMFLESFSYFEKVY